ncbi:hypothetical protein OPU71_12690 [Niveibacterium sp. 24ML]|uniref:hypothetical protein n=1 Tax=Niveibacterium sp. 24ML TaxID=2985512 RepID=UPI00226D7A21|nr:hypothetical protein [Niveibacterium sp. 24ML]MCX9156983.1 hypothetical protein [Niveibacterium sp. 24ML]
MSKMQDKGTNVPGKCRDASCVDHHSSSEALTENSPEQTEEHKEARCPSSNGWINQMLTCCQRAGDTAQSGQGSIEVQRRNQTKHRLNSEENLERDRSWRSVRFNEITTAMYLSQPDDPQSIDSTRNCQSGGKPRPARVMPLT